MTSATVCRWAIVFLSLFLLLQLAEAAGAETRTYDTQCWYRWSDDTLLYCEEPVQILRDPEVAPKPQRDPFDRRPRLAEAA